MTTAQHILVSGANGFVGSSLCGTLAARGHRVTALVRRPLPQASTGIHPWQVTDLAQLGANGIDRLRGVDAVVHCAGRAHQLKDRVEDPLTAFRAVNSEATLKFAELAARAGVRRFIHLSSIGVSGGASPQRPLRREDTPQPGTPYAQSKWEAEQQLDELARRSDMAIVHLRPPLIYGRDAPGNFGLLLRALRSGLPLPLGGMREPRSFIALDNLVDLIAHLVERAEPARGLHLVSDGQDLSTADFVTAMARAARLPVRIWPLPVPLLLALATPLGRADQVRKLAVRLQVDSSPLASELGWHPPHHLEQALAKALAPASRP